MRSVYQRASRRIVFLGGDEETTRARSRMLYEMVRSHNIHGGSRVEFSGFFMGKRHSLRWQAIMAFAGDPYFERSWVVQKIAVGQDLQL